MKPQIYLCLLIGALLTAACQSGRTLPEVAEQTGRPVEELAEALESEGFDVDEPASAKVDDDMYRALLLYDIEKSEEELYGKNNDFRFDEAKAQKTVDAYVAFTEAFPDDAATPGYLFKSADLLRALKKNEEALAYYERICSDYPGYEKVPHSLFLQGFVYENDLKDLDQARAKYEAFIEQYPDHELADDVEFSLKYLGKSPEEIIKEFEQTPPQEEAETQEPS